jgi:hypothetical protein
MPSLPVNSENKITWDHDPSKSHNLPTFCFVSNISSFSLFGTRIPSLPVNSENRSGWDQDKITHRPTDEQLQSLLRALMTESSSRAFGSVFWEIEVNTFGIVRVGAGNGGDRGGGENRWTNPNSEVGWSNWIHGITYFPNLREGTVNMISDCFASSILRVAYCCKGLS